MIIPLIVIFVLLTVIFISYEVYHWKKHLSSMNGMMIAMTFAMMTSLTIGMTISLKVVNDPTLATIYTIVLGIFIGYVMGYPFGILAQLDGVLAGIMGGLMGPMTGLMISNSSPNLFIGFFILLYVFTTFLVFQLIQKSIPSPISKRMNRTWYLFLPMCIILAVLAIVQLSNSTILHANTQKSSTQKTSYQEATIEVNENGYSPNQISLKVGIPAKLHFQKKSSTGCLSYLSIPDQGIHRELKSGDNIISFTPKKSGTIKFSCGMGMYHGSLILK
jgi:hypothetical protein